MRKIIHVDMDSFFVSIEERDNPKLRNKAVAVGGSADSRGVICTANYVARKFGVHSAMSTARAISLCPDLIIVPPDIQKYRTTSKNIFSIFRKYSEIIEPIGLDEAFLDVTLCEKFYNSATWIAADIRKQIFLSEKLTSSAGISTNKFLAKVSSNWNKPNGQFVVPPEFIQNFVRTLPIGKIFGVGPKTEKKLHEIGIKNCSELQQIPLPELMKKFGKFGKYLYDLSRGVDERPVESNRCRKSLSIEETFPKDLNKEECNPNIESIYERLKVRLEKVERKYNKIFVKVKFDDFVTTTHEKIEKQLNIEIVKQLFDEAIDRCENKKIRLLGVGVRFNNETYRQLNLFTN